jgi:hypothetical protein
VFVKYLRATLLLGVAILLAACNFPASSGGAGTTYTPPAIQYTQPIPTASPTATVTPTPEVTPTPGIVDAQQIAVIFISDGGALDIESAPGESQPVIATLSPHAENLTLTGDYEWQTNDQLWVKITGLEGSQGWVNADYLIEQVPPETFCLDQRVTRLVSEFTQAIQNRDGKAFAGLVSPLHGLAIRHEWWNPQVRIKSKEKLQAIFTSTENYDWGVQDGSGLPLNGSFRDIILPLLDDGLENSASFCNTLEQGFASGGTTGYTQWPFEYANINYVALYRPAKEGDDLNWRTWALGIEFYGDQVYLVTLVQYHWEI